ncbi:respiratory nitrate reductase subunit gamma [bacterium]|nr:respiratory nitrate reductase subunit gamma [Porticoccaceae bacterium]MDB4076719.1 respiratory nitrate reductase subunit gamma [Porticoccaceae bacterium]MDB9814659.1 respiratory nitrate reductase subunit gamma [bacterium]MDB9951816.1 respiratory nitrate reductase subunit gamma [Porticoccaceae bacterium]MDB9998989.1 respiratory nitrate reductase subunit gamma [Porticoccaceae bacterium]
MSSTLNTFLFGLYPYIALAICLAVSWVRFDHDQYSWKADSSQILGNKGMRLGSNLFHIGVIFILAGHFIGLLTPESIYHHVISTPNKQLLAMVSGGVFGILCLIGLLILLHRRLFNPRVRANSRWSDIAVLIILLVQLLLGLGTILASSNHLDGSVMVQLGEWAQSIVTLQPLKAANAIATVSLVYKLHVFLGLSIVLIFPFTRLVHVISAPIWYFGRNYQIIRQKKS